MIIGNRQYKDRVYIMGILNVTPDSFSDGSKYNTLDTALFRAEEITNQGGDIIDVGGESTRPDYTQISVEEEISRVVPVIEALKARFDLPISIDTYKSDVAKAAVEAGATLINDIWGFKCDKKMAEITAKYNVACCLMHNRKSIENNLPFTEQVIAELKQSVDIALNAGVDKNKICIDPGVGFGKTYEQNLEIINKLEALTSLGYPVLLGTSRKSVIGITLDLPVSDRVEGTIATSVIGVMKGCRFIRVHDVQANKRAVVMTEKILGEI